MPTSDLTCHIANFCWICIFGTQCFGVSCGGSTFGPSLYPDIEKVPAIMPVEVNLDGTEEQIGLMLREEKTRQISGKVLLEDDSPANGIRAVATIMGGGTSVKICEAITDESGEYSLVVPASAMQFGVRVDGKRDSEGKMLYGMPSPHPDVERSFFQSIWFKKNDEQDLEEINWTLRRRE